MFFVFFRQIWCTIEEYRLFCWKITDNTVEYGDSSARWRREPDCYEMCDGRRYLYGQ